MGAKVTEVHGLLTVLRVKSKVSLEERTGKVLSVALTFMLYSWLLRARSKVSSLSFAKGAIVGSPSTT